MPLQAAGGLFLLHEAGEAEPVVFQRHDLRGKRVGRVFGALLEIGGGVVQEQLLLFARQGVHAEAADFLPQLCQIGVQAAVHRGEQAALLPAVGHLFGGGEGAVGIFAAHQEQDLAVELFFARFVCRAPHRVHLRVGGQQRGEVSLQTVSLRYPPAQPRGGKSQQ